MKAAALTLRYSDAPRGQEANVRYREIVERSITTNGLNEQEMEKLRI